MTKHHVMLLAMLGLLAFEARADEGRAAAGDAVVLHRLYPKAKTVEVAASAGFLLNPTYVDTQFLQLGARWHWSESWGLGFVLGRARTKDRAERECVESFYNDPLHERGAPCLSQDDAGGWEKTEEANIGPAYPRIRELTGLATVFADYSLAYGKQILLHGATSYFDLRLRFGAALIRSRLYGEESSIGGDASRPARGDPLGEGGAPKAGVSVDDVHLYGEAGRPTPSDETTPAFYFALAEEMHFFRRFFVLGELGGYVMPVTDVGPELFFMAQLGAGVRF